MRKFKLLKDFPDIDAGAIGEERDGSIHWKSMCVSSAKSKVLERFRYQSYPLDFVINNQDWFEEVKDRFPESWDELSGNHKSILFESKEDTLCYYALFKTKQLLSKYETCYDRVDSFSIGLHVGDNELLITQYSLFKTLLSFKEKYQAEHFLKHHIELIKKASPLIFGTQI